MNSAAACCPARISFNLLILINCILGKKYVVCNSVCRSCGNPRRLPEPHSAESQCRLPGLYRTMQSFSIGHGACGPSVPCPAGSIVAFSSAMSHTCALLLSVGLAVFLLLVPPGLVKLHVVQRCVGGAAGASTPVGLQRVWPCKYCLHILSSHTASHSGNVSCCECRSGVRPAALC